MIRARVLYTRHGEPQDTRVVLLGVQSHTRSYPFDPALSSPSLLLLIRYYDPSERPQNHQVHGSQWKSTKDKPWAMVPTTFCFFLILYLQPSGWRRSKKEIQVSFMSTKRSEEQQLRASQQKSTVFKECQKIHTAIRIYPTMFFS